VYIDDELSRDDGAGRRLWAVVEDDWRRLDGHVHGRSQLRLDLRALLVLMTLLVAEMALEREAIHDEVLLGLRLFFDRRCVRVYRREKRLVAPFDVVKFGQWRRSHADQGLKQSARHG
jgi:hypothetical protein